MTVFQPPRQDATLPRYNPALPPTEELDYVDLAIIDLSKLSTEAGKAELVVQARDAMKHRGFMYVVNHGFTLEQTDRIFDIANLTFTGISDEEKVRYAARMLEDGTFQGYKAPQYWHIDAGVHDRIESYNLNRDVYRKQHPEIIRPFLPDLTTFAKHSHFNVVHPILRLLAIGMGLPEDTFAKLHNFDGFGETYMRFLKYYPRPEEEEMKTNNVWLKGHTDIGCITVLYSQPVAALQILSADGKWRWIRHMSNALVINVGDALEYLSGGFYQATIHRVVQPPPSQRGQTRLGIFYFAQPDDHTKLLPCTDEVYSESTNKKFKFADPAAAPTMEEYRKGRTAAYGKSETKKVVGDERVEEQVINGVVVKHYN